MERRRTRVARTRVPRRGGGSFSRPPEADDLVDSTGTRVVLVSIVPLGIVAAGDGVLAFKAAVESKRRRSRGRVVLHRADRRDIEIEPDGGQRDDLRAGPSLYIGRGLDRGVAGMPPREEPGP